MNRSFSRAFATSSVVVGALAIASFGSVGCGSSSSSSASSDPDAVNDGTDVSSTESNIEGVGTSLAGGSGGGTMQLSLATSDELTGGPSGSAGSVAPQDIGDAAKSFFMPSTCLVVTNDAKSSTVTYAFTNCTGPYGLVKVNGTVSVGYTAPSADELKLTFSATNFQVNGATVASWTGNADIVSNGSARTMNWTGMYTGTTARGTSFTHSSTRTVTWTVGGDCLGETGSSSGQIGSLDVKVDVTNFQVCKGSCPMSGSEITITDQTDSATYDLTYGDNTATYTNPAGKMVTYKPYCADN